MLAITYDKIRKYLFKVGKTIYRQHKFIKNFNNLL